MRTAMLVGTMTALALWDPLNARPEPAIPPAAPLASRAAELPGSRLPVLKERHYVMSGAARPLLFWAGRHDIGLARIVWRGKDDGPRGYELLVGTDPARAPRGINRWGYISEETLGDSGSALALMTGSHETSYEDEAEHAARAPAGGEFRTIRSEMQDGSTAWQLEDLRTSKALTVHQVADALERIELEPGELRKRRPVGANVRPGFLVAVADVVDATLAASRKGPRLSISDVPAVQYVFGEKTYELRVRKLDPVVVSYAGRQVQALKTSFQTRALATGSRTRFELTTGTTGDTAGVPLSIEWQPRWWLKVKLDLADPRQVP